MEAIAGTSLGVYWGGENRRVYRWHFNPIFVPYLLYIKVSGVRFQVSGFRNDEHRRWVSLYLGL